MKFALALLLIVAPPALAWNEPDGILGVPWGATQEELRAKLQHAGEPPKCLSAESCSGVRTTVGTVPVGVQYLFPNNGKFELAVFTFKPEDYRRVRLAFIERYGAPTASRVEPARAAGCKGKLNHVAEWSGERVLIKMNQYNSRTEGRATIMLKAARDSEGTDAESDKPAKDKS
jgi:hypothetical protein